ncbi:hypothetical protein ACEPAF_5331 [Sanghuangporus sanghuang]
MTMRYSSGTRSTIRHGADWSSDNELSRIGETHSFRMRGHHERPPPRKLILLSRPLSNCTQQKQSHTPASKECCDQWQTPLSFSVGWMNMDVNGVGSESSVQLPFASNFPDSARSMMANASMDVNMGENGNPWNETTASGIDATNPWTDAGNAQSATVTQSMPVRARSSVTVQSPFTAPNLLSARNTRAPRVPSRRKHRTYNQPYPRYYKKYHTDWGAMGVVSIEEDGLEWSRLERERDESRLALEQERKNLEAQKLAFDEEARKLTDERNRERLELESRMKRLEEEKEILRQQMEAVTQREPEVAQQYIQQVEIQHEMEAQNECGPSGTPTEINNEPCPETPAEVHDEPHPETPEGMQDNLSPGNPAEITAWYFKRIDQEMDCKDAQPGQGCDDMFVLQGELKSCCARSQSECSNKQSKEVIAAFAHLFKFGKETEFERHTPARRTQVDAYNRSGEQGPTPNDLRLDVFGQCTSRWNKKVIEIIYENILQQKGVASLPQEFENNYWSAITFKIRRARYFCRKLIPRIKEPGVLETTLEVFHRRKQQTFDRQKTNRHNSRRLKIYRERVETCLKCLPVQHDPDSPWSYLAREVLELGPDGMSSDESNVGEANQRVFHVKTLPWRTKDAEKQFQFIDKQCHVLKKNRGSGPRNRIRDHKFVSTRQAPSGRAGIIYNAEWLQGKSWEQREVQEAVSTKRLPWVRVHTVQTV